MPTIFLSHSSKDKRFARRLAKSLTDHGVEVWVDEAAMLPGDSLVDSIGAAIQESDYIGVILSPDSVASGWVKKEVEIAINDEIESGTLSVIPILYRACEVPPFLRGRIWADFSKPKSYAAGLERLLLRLIGNSLRRDMPDPKLPKGDEVWKPKMVRLGFSWGLLTRQNNEIVFTEKFVAALCENATTLATEDIDKFFEWGFVPLYTRSIGDTKAEIPITEEDFLSFVEDIGMPIVAHLFHVATQAKVFMPNPDSEIWTPDEDFYSEFYAMAEVPIEEKQFSDTKDIKKWAIQSLYELVQARLLVNAPDDSRYAHLLALYIDAWWSFSKRVELVWSDYT